MIGGRVFDTGAIAPFLTGATLYPRAFLQTALTQAIVVVVPTVALTKAARRVEVVGCEGVGPSRGPSSEPVPYPRRHCPGSLQCVPAAQRSD